MKQLIARVRKRKNRRYRRKNKYNKGKITIPLLIKAIDGSYGNINIIAEKMNRPYSTVYAYIKNSPDDEIQELLEMEREKLYDVAEDGVAELMLQSINYPTKLGACKFTLISGPKSGKRGYKEKREVTVEGGKHPLNIKNENVVSLDKMKTIPLEVRRQMLEEMNEKEEEEKEE